MQKALILQEGKCQFSEDTLRKVCFGFIFFSNELFLCAIGRRNTGNCGDKFGLLQNLTMLD